MPREVRADDLRRDTSSCSLVSVSVVLNQAKDRKSGVQLAGYISNSMHGNEESNRGTPVASARRSTAGKHEGSESLGDTLLDVDISTSVSALCLGTGHPLVNLPCDCGTGNLAPAGNEAGNVIVGSGVHVGNRREGGVHARTGDASGHCEGGADLHEISISSEDSSHEKKSTDDFGNVGCVCVNMR